MVLVITALVTSLYAALITILADQQPELAIALSLLVVLAWLLIGYVYLL